jgi:hypothetical protein
VLEEVLIMTKGGRSADLVAITQKTRESARSISTDRSTSAASALHRPLTPPAAALLMPTARAMNAVSAAFRRRTTATCITRGRVARCAPFRRFASARSVPRERSRFRRRCRRTVSLAIEVFRVVDLGQFHDLDYF